MNTKDHEELIRDLISSYCLLSTELSYVDSVHEWCKENGVDEPDRNKPVRFILQGERACTVVINDIIPKKILEERINALSVRSALVNVANNRADKLDSERKQIAYLILSDYAATVQIPEDELLADQWVFDEMDKRGFFRE